LLSGVNVNHALNEGREISPGIGAAPMRSGEGEAPDIPRQLLNIAMQYDDLANSVERLLQLN
jgi:hypothetical protein